MYLDHYLLKSHPFRITPDSSLFFSGDYHGRGMVLDALLYGIQAGEGIIKVVGEVGSGKTMLCRMLEERLPEKVEIVYLANPNLRAEDILYAIAFELKLNVGENTGRLLAMRKLQEYLLRQHANGFSVVVFIEEAQGMPLETLEELRLFSNLETHHHKLMQIVMFGQPELDKKLEQKSIRQLRERITHSFYLTPLTANQIGEYIDFRMKAAGCPKANVFSDKAGKLIAKKACGLLRRVNILSDKALLAAYVEFSQTNSSETDGLGDVNSGPVVFRRHVKMALQDSSFSRNVEGGFRSWFRYSGVAFASVMAVAMLVTGFQQRATLSSMVPSIITKALAKNEHAGSNQNTGIENLMLEQKNNVSKQLLPKSVNSSASVITETYVDDEMSVDSEGFTLFSSRQSATRVWYQNAQKKQAFTLQLYSGLYQDEKKLEKMLGILKNENLLEQSFVCASESKETGEMYWSVLYDQFDSINQSMRVIEDLPLSIKRNAPYVRNIDRVNCNNA